MNAVSTLLFFHALCYLMPRFYLIITIDIFQAESPEGRAWMLSESCLLETISHITKLLNNDNLWTASNAALVLARY